MNQIIDFFQNLFDTSDFPARWHCGEWSSFHGWLYIISNLMVWSAYFMIPLIIIRYITRQRKKVPFHKVYFWFAAFIVLCGAGHFIDALIFWTPVYRFNALVLFATGVVSWITVFLLLKMLPLAFTLKTNKDLQSEINLRIEKEKELLKYTDKLLHAETLAKMCSWTWDLKSNTISWSRSTYSLFNLPLEHHLDYSAFINAVHYEDQTYFKTSVDAIILNKQFHKLNFRVITPQRQIKDVVCYGEVICDENGEAIQIIGTLQDVTEKKIQLRTIEEKNKKLVEISYIQSHAIRGQVATILGLTEIFNIQDYDDKKNETVIEGIRVSAQNLDNIIKELTNVIEDKQ